MQTSRCRQNFHEASESGINRQINMELAASYAYLSLHAYFSYDDVALPGCAQFFKKCAHEETEHAEKLIRYLAQRGGRLALEDIKAPTVTSTSSVKEAMAIALDMEKSVNEVSANMLPIGQSVQLRSPANRSRSGWLGCEWLCKSTHNLANQPHRN
ncbi:unnamed protein product [Protopolystoma xenopodis]|uniref:Ferritin n=1 Tax=Protopolystoma xenopodis TaxID=117903 RepID=A0A3S5B3A1_9PLAT|nr:unnamed protein product [Protopolystoma xenopodis]